jgi:3-mercaptopyruvate sulfurtransferase SseA
MGNRHRTVLLLMVLGGGILILLAGLAIAYINSPVARVKTPTPGTVAEVKRVTLADAKAAFDNGAAVFVDVRDAGSYDKSHIPGALLIPLSQLGEHLGELDKSIWIITYCT